MSKTGRLFSTFVLGFFLIPSLVFADLDADVSAGRKLLAEGDALADKGSTTEAVVLYKRAFEQLLPGMRKLSFKHEVKRDVTNREDMSAMLIKEIDAEMTPAEFRANELGMKVLGLLPRNFNLKETMVKVYSEEIAAFYDTKTKTMHLIKEPAAKAEKPPTFLERLLGKKAGFDKDENKTVIAHELTHALADQNFNLDKMQSSIKRDDDRDLALSALIEGEATLTMFGAQMEDWTGTEAPKMPAAGLDRVFSLMMPFMPLAGGTSLREAPVVLSETMIFPYLRGLVFCAHLTNEGGWSALSEAYKRPPLSTEQILHPEKYQAKPDSPTAIDLGKLEAGEGWKELGRNVVGEMQLGILLRRHGGKKAAAGWDGDRFAVFEGPNERLGLVWFSTWDTEEDAREFERGYADFQKTKVADEAEGAAEAVQKLAKEAVPLIERRGQDVVVVEGFSQETTGPLVEAAFRATKTEMTYESPSKDESK
ncbi:hypothetical protein [Singulisphaera acidiphila]|uniref:Uncharacterized protein n=1 Tax=Singulisphaera acidiphila (strain ATCC BAA-1392 / DSM 18658 / VKM B-2454 / MOB10) TaxID=886293 RepID=L0DAX3_SINAD|nr:hypothetical protein [Singulisphaera acidiphila]AGA25821.1 hypothetical protein Sinac_1439 [Singulisphaera acidiphila DSM 18658]